MPELIEVEVYRRTALKSIGRSIASVEVIDPFALRHGADGSAGASSPGAKIVSALTGSTVVAARRIGKLLLLDLDQGSVLGLRFGMTGRLVVDDRADIDELLYTSDRNDVAWDRFRVRFDDGGSMAVRDPRRLGGVELDPDASRLGPDATALSLAQLRSVLAGSSAPVKARLLDQQRVAGIGNLLADEILWRAGIAPQVLSSSLSTARVRRLQSALSETLVELTERGGSHLGDVMEARAPGGRCPRDGTPMRTATVGGRTSWWCPKHQR